MLKPFSDNIVFLDTELSSLNPYKGEILSIGLVKYSGEELYLELEFEGDVDPWVQENIIPTLTHAKVSREQAKRAIKDFIGDSKPYMLAYVNSLDVVFYAKLFAKEGKAFDLLPPFHWVPIDFATLLFGSGVDPESYYKEKENSASIFGVSTSQYKIHNALDDARLLREVYLKLIASEEIG